MKDVWNVAQVVFAAVGGGIGWFFGELDGFFYALLAFVVIDYLTGVMCAIADCCEAPWQREAVSGDHGGERAALGRDPGGHGS